MRMTNAAITNIEKELEVARVTNDHEQKKLFHIQISMFKHAQHMFDMAVKSARHEGGADE